ncbi:uncharacterized protein DS421_13g443410 [Arachis hypogaea]|nr:uncharacterized protein DS421_13g443410 [Arachis hypogaea]
MLVVVRTFLSKKNKKDDFNTKKTLITILSRKLQEGRFRFWSSTLGTKIVLIPY